MSMQSLSLLGSLSESGHQCSEHLSGFWSLVSVPRLTSGGIKVPDPLGAVVDISVSNGWIIGCKIDPARSSKSLNMLSSRLSCVSFSCTAISSSSVSTSNSYSIVPPLCT
ncbi:hypothetical protein H5410_030517 [Solanum commersonii]|uniref:Uncharacterized protein n=1 Tax=Solanum commersonii TaxID=4109 RepID=A0A9J5YEI1_SOLCO|nr:hypothetical protein H5410_030517 [Solanum commersonii]